MQTPISDFLESHSLNEDLKPTKKMGSHLTSLCKPDSPQDGLGEFL